MKFKKCKNCKCNTCIRTWNDILKSIHENPLENKNILCKDYMCYICQEINNIIGTKCDKYKKEGVA